MGAGHGHGHSGDLDTVPVPRLARRLLIGFLVAVGVATLVGLVVLWPRAGDAPPPAGSFAAPGLTFERAAVTDVAPSCGGTEEASDPDAACDQIDVRLDSGPEAGESRTIRVPPAVAVSGVAAGDEVTVMRTPGSGEIETTYSLFNIERGTPLTVLGIVFLLVVLAVARLRGLLAVVGVGAGAFLVVEFMLPALVAGRPGALVALVGSSAILYVVLYLAHGVTVRTSAALAGTLVAVAITAGISIVSIGAARLSGFSDEGGATLTSYVPDLDFQGLLTCAVIIAGLGVLNDVTITQASAVWELRQAAPELRTRDLFSRGMRIGRDHIASTIYTIVFAYVGAALSVLILLSLYGQPLPRILSVEEFSTEIVRTLASAISLVLAVPITTGIAALTVGSGRRRSAGKRART